MATTETPSVEKTIEALSKVVEVLRRQVQEQAQTIEQQHREICRLGIEVSHLPLFQETTERGIGVLRSGQALIENDIAEIQEQLWPGRRAQWLAEIKARYASDKQHDDDRTE